MAHAEGPETDEIRLFAASLAHDPDGIELPYLVLDHVATRHHLAEAVLVLRPGPMGTQLFVRGRAPVPGDEAGSFLGRPIGLYTQPDVLDPTVRAALAGICNMALAAHVVRNASAIDAVSGLFSRDAIEASLVRAASSGARYGWTFTAVLLATGGEGSAADRWAALTGALRTAARTGDEMGVAGAGRALAILGNAGPDVVRPFVARVRAALSSAGDEAVDLHAATVTSPMETVDPEAVWSLLNDRLDELVGPGGRDQGERPGDAVGLARAYAVPAALELALRSLPAVVSVGPAPHPSGVGYQIEVVAVGPTDALAAMVTRRTREYRVEAPVVLIGASGPTTETGTAAMSAAAVIAASGGTPWVITGSPENGTARAVATVPPATVPPATHPPGAVPGSGSTTAADTALDSVARSGVPEADILSAPVPQLSAPGITPAVQTSEAKATSPTAATTSATTSATTTAPARSSLGATTAEDAVDPDAAGDRVTLLRATFDSDTGISEVHLSRAGALGVGRATVGPLAGGAQATLAALGELGVRVPYYLVSAERAHTVPGEPVVVVLAPRRAADPAGGNPPLAERIGVSSGPDNVGAAARSTLSALNRFLSSAGASER